MDEIEQKDQSVLEIEDSNNQTPLFHTHKKLAIIISACLIFLTFGAGAFYVSSQSANKIPIVSPIPTVMQYPTISPTPTNQSVSPTYPWEKSVCGNNVCEKCESDNDCCNYPCVDGACPPPECIGLCLNDCRSTETVPTYAPPKDQLGSCQSDSDCPARNGCILHQCFSGECRKINMCNQE